MELEKLLELPLGKKWLEMAQAEKQVSSSVDLSRAKEIKITDETYLEAQSKGISVTELLETSDYDPTPVGSPLDAFERQLAVHNIRVSGKSPSTVELFYQGLKRLKLRKKLT